MLQSISAMPDHDKRSVEEMRCDAWSKAGEPGQANGQQGGFGSAQTVGAFGASGEGAFGGSSVGGVSTSPSGGFGQPSSTPVFGHAPGFRFGTPAKPPFENFRATGETPGFTLVLSSKQPVKHQDLALVHLQNRLSKIFEQLVKHQVLPLVLRSKQPVKHQDLALVHLETRMCLVRVLQRPVKHQSLSLVRLHRRRQPGNLARTPPAPSAPSPAPARRSYTTQNCFKK